MKLQFLLPCVGIAEIEKTKASITRERKLCAPSSFQFWNAELDCSYRNGTAAHRLSFLFTQEGDRFIPKLFLQLFPSFPETTIPMHVLRAKILWKVPFIDKLSI